MKAKKGSKIEAVVPQDPEEVFAADEANPGKIAEVKAEQKSKSAGKYGQTKLPAHKPKGSGSSPAKSEGSKSSSGAAAGAAANNATSKSDDKESSQEEKKSWLGILLCDEKGKPIVGEKYEVVLPDGTLVVADEGKKGTGRLTLYPGTKNR